MKKTLSVLIALILLVSTLSVSAFADNATAPTSANAYVTIASADGSLAVAYEKINVTDSDGDNALTVNDALYCAHQAKYTGGAEAGYSWYNSEYGVSMGKLWGDTSGNFGYYLNSTPAMSLTDEIKEGDHVYALVFKGVYPDMESFSYFDTEKATKTKGESITLTLCSVGYDAEWKPVSTPVSGATLTVNGQATSFKTDAEGKVTLTLDRTGELVVSAVCDTVAIAPPVCVISVYSDAKETNETANGTEKDTAQSTEENNEKASENGGCSGALTASAICVLTTALTGTAVIRRKNKDEE